MSSWPTALTGRTPALLLALAVGCREAPPPERSSQAPSPSVPPPPATEAPHPWFQGQWHGGAPTSGPTELATGGAAAPVVVHLLVDSQGIAAGSSSLQLAFRGAIDGETLRLEGEGPGGHGVVVLHRQAATLHGILHYAARAAAQGQNIPLTLTRAEAP